MPRKRKRKPVMDTTDVALQDRLDELDSQERNQTILDAVAGFGQTATFGLGDELYAGTDAAFRTIGGFLMGQPVDFGTDYDNALARERLRLKIAAENSPVANMTGGAVGLAPAVIAGIVSRQPVAVEAALGALSGFGSGEDAKTRLQNGFIGLMLGGGGATAGNVGSFVGLNTSKIISGLINNQAKTIGRAARVRKMKLERAIKKEQDVLNNPTTLYTKGKDAAAEDLLQAQDALSQIKPVSDVLNFADNVTGAITQGIDAASKVAPAVAGAVTPALLTEQVQGDIPPTIDEQLNQRLQQLDAENNIDAQLEARLKELDANQ